jgi:hypothetical protein
MTSVSISFPLKSFSLLLISSLDMLQHVYQVLVFCFSSEYLATLCNYETVL